MPIKPELRYLYPIDWPQISHWVRFVRANGRCQVCGRPHGAWAQHLGDGRWWDEAQQTWRDGRGRNAARRSGWDWPDNQDDGQGWCRNAGGRGPTGVTTLATAHS